MSTLLVSSAVIFFQFSKTIHVYTLETDLVRSGPFYINTLILKSMNGNHSNLVHAKQIYLKCQINTKLEIRTLNAV